MRTVNKSAGGLRGDSSAAAMSGNSSRPADGRRHLRSDHRGPSRVRLRRRQVAAQSRSRTLSGDDPPRVILQREGSSAEWAHRKNGHHFRCPRKRKAPKIARGP